MLTGIGAPTAWPFFKRAGGPAVIRTVLGKNTAILSLTIQLNAINVAVGDMLMVGVVNDNRVLAGAPVVDLNGNNLNVDASRTYLTLRLEIHSLLIPAAVVLGTLTATWAVAPTNSAMLAIKVSGLVGTRKANLNPVGANTANPDSGTTAAYAAAKNFHFGCVGTVGNGADLLGVWQNAMTAGQRASQPAIGPPLGVDLKEGYRIPAAPVGAQANIHNQSLRASLAQVVYYE